MLARATAATPWGIEARPVQVEVDVHNGLPQWGAGLVLAGYAAVFAAVGLALTTRRDVT